MTLGTYAIEIVAGDGILLLPKGHHGAEGGAGGASWGVQAKPEW